MKIVEELFSDLGKFAREPVKKLKLCSRFGLKLRRIIPTKIQ